MHAATSGPDGGIFVAETLIPALTGIAAPAYEEARPTRPSLPSARVRTQTLRRSPQPDLPRQALVGDAGGAQIYLKREDLNHTGAPTRSTTASARPCSPAAWASPRDRRDRRRPARRRDGHRGGPLRHGVRGLHGARRTSSARRQRLSHEAARRHRGAGRERARRRSRTRSTKRCATGSRTSHDTFYIIGTVAGPIPIR